METKSEVRYDVAY